MSSVGSKGEGWTEIVTLCPSTICPPVTSTGVQRSEGTFEGGGSNKSRDQEDLTSGRPGEGKETTGEE